MMQTHWLVREAFGAAFSAGLTVAIFGMPLLGSLIGSRTDRVSQLLERPPVEASFDREAHLSEQAGMWVRLHLPEEAPEEDLSDAFEVEIEAPRGTDEAAPEIRAAAPAEEPSRPVSRPAPVEPGPGTAEAPAEEGGEPADGSQARGTDGEEERETRLREIRERVRSGRPSARGKGRCSASHPDIAKMSDTRYTVDRELIRYYTANFERLKSLGWSGRHAEEDLVGWRISGFGCNSPLFHAGLRRNDVIQSVNGRNTRNALQVFAAWKALRNQEAFEVVLVRRGEQLRLYFDVI